MISPVLQAKEQTETGIFEEELFFASSAATSTSVTSLPWPSSSLSAGIAKAVGKAPEVEGCVVEVEEEVLSPSSGTENMMSSTSNLSSLYHFPMIWKRGIKPM